MALAIGSRIGTYEIGQLAGRGGMGEVYRARDTRLKRDVAIKVLPTEFAQDPDRIQRFQHEAEALAALNHPNIAGIYALEESGGTRFLVLEFVEGGLQRRRLDELTSLDVIKKALDRECRHIAVGTAVGSPLFLRTNRQARANLAALPPHSYLHLLSHAYLSPKVGLVPSRTKSSVIPRHQTFHQANTSVGQVLATNWEKAYTPAHGR